MRGARRHRQRRRRRRKTQGGALSLRGDGWRHLSARLTNFEPWNFSRVEAEPR